MRFAAAALMFVFALAMTTAAEEERARCELCGMFWEASSTRVMLEVDLGEDSAAHMFESLNCAYNGLNEVYDEEPDVLSFMILDYATFDSDAPTMLDGFESNYLYGTSRLKGSMAPFIAAFATEKAALAAQAQLGGELVDFDGMMALLAEHNGDEYTGPGHEGLGSANGGMAYICPCSGGCCDDIVASEPGTCSRCGMTLVAQGSEE